MTTLVNYTEFVRPSKLVLELSNNKTVTITPKHSFRDKQYQAWLQLCDSYSDSDSAKKAIDTMIPQLTTD